MSGTVDQARRLEVAGIVAAYLRGEIDNFALDDVVMEYNGPDQSIRRIGRELWMCYDDIKQHHVSLSSRQWKLFRRCIAFLQTDLTLPEKSTDTRNPNVWPFQRRIDLFSARPDLDRFNLPKFDLSRHSLPVRSWDINLGPGWLWLVGALLAIAWLVLR